MNIPATSPFSLSGRRILITGAAGGIGSAAARLCAQHGADLILADMLPPPAIVARTGGKEADCYNLDISDRNAVFAFAAAVGPVYGLIDAAGICPLDDWMADDWDEALERVLAVNVRGPLNLTRAFFPGMAARGEGRIVLTGSVAGWMGGVLSGPHYAFSKGGIHAFTRWLARRGAPHNVLVNAIAPGAVATGMTIGTEYEKTPQPLGHMAAPEEIAGAALFLASPAASFMTGSVMDVNGGVFFH
jgi:NAD(P)-dependent dehydrogenase (short-subunit alcohol dehydrogenase family)